MTDRELDELVAEKVMGLSLCKCSDEEWKKYRDTHQVLGLLIWVIPTGQCIACGSFRLPHYSTLIQDAWLVVEKLRAIKSQDSYTNFSLEQADCLEGGDWCVETHLIDKREVPIWAHDPSASRAICLAALKAHGVQV